MTFANNKENSGEVTHGTKPVVPRFFTSDEKYAPYLSVALESLIENAGAIDSSRKYCAIIVHQDLSQDAQERLASMATSNVSVELFPMDNLLVNAISSDTNKLRADYVTMTIYFRLFIATMFPHIDKALYLDSDTVIDADVAELFDIDLQGNLIAAVHDNFISANKETTDYVVDALGMPVGDYINSGVLVMDLKQLRDVDFAGRFTALLNEHHVESIAADQDYLNVMCHGQIKMLDREWNTMMADGSDGPENPKIIHYNLFGKPWHYKDATNADRFWAYAPQTPYYHHLRHILADFTQTEANSDALKKSKLIQHALAIPGRPVTFKKLIDKGVRVRV